MGAMPPPPANEHSRMTTMFSTYQSIGVIHEAQRQGLEAFDLVICDEAHRTTGATLVGEDESYFVRVHDPRYIASNRRLYMTATPRLFDDSTKSQADRSNAILCSMDDEQLYGPELYRLGFGEAVEQGLLTDYKVIVLAVEEQYVATTFRANWPTRTPSSTLTTRSRSSDAGMVCRAASAPATTPSTASRCAVPSPSRGPSKTQSASPTSSVR